MPTEPFARLLRRDLELALRTGAVRDPDPAPNGASWLAVLIALCAAAGLGLWLLGGYHAGFGTLNASAAAYPPRMWEWLTVLGDERVAFALALFFSRRHPRLFWALICAALVAVAYSRGLKPLFDARRPPGVLAPGSFHLIGEGPRRESFPSGHSVTAAVFFGVLLYEARGIGWRLVFASVALLAGLSRVAVGVHWPVDVAAGLAGGFASAWVGIWLAHRGAWGVRNVPLHLALVILCALMAASLFWSDGGYPGARRLMQTLGAGALLVALAGYLLLPLWRWQTGKWRE